MQEEGRVIKVEKGSAWVEFAETPACSKCSACSLAASGKRVIEADNSTGAKEGDIVKVEIPAGTKTFFPFVAFGIPILFFLAGTLLGSFFSELFGILVGVAFLFLGFLLVRMGQACLVRQRGFKARIVKIN